MAARLAADAEIETSDPPFRTMWREAATAGAKLREQMRQLMTQCAVDFLRAEGAETTIEQHSRAAIFGATGRTA
jgi:hypothetical protein